MASALLAERLKLAPDIAAATWARAADPVGGLRADAAFDASRTSWRSARKPRGSGGGQPPAPEKYVDLSYYQRALRTLGR
jgi:hypothetical protein